MDGQQPGVDWPSGAPGVFPVAWPANWLPGLPPLPQTTILHFSCEIKSHTISFQPCIPTLIDSLICMSPMHTNCYGGYHAQPLSGVLSV